MRLQGINYGLEADTLPDSMGLFPPEGKSKKYKNPLCYYTNGSIVYHSTMTVILLVYSHSIRLVLYKIIISLKYKILEYLTIS